MEDPSREVALERKESPQFPLWQSKDKASCGTVGLGFLHGSHGGTRGPGVPCAAAAAAQGAGPGWPRSLRTAGESKLRR